MSRDSFLVDTVNANYRTHWVDLKPALVKRREKGVGLFCFQEISSPDVRRGIERDLDLQLVFHPRQYGVAFDPDLWPRLIRSRGGEVGPAYGSRSGRKQRSGFALAVLEDQAGRRLKAVAMHPPSGVQVKGAPTRIAPNRVAALRASVRFLSRTAHTGGVDAMLAGLDDNVDETRPNARGEWPFLEDRHTGLTQVQPPRGTHGPRKIDPFYTFGLEAGDGETYPTPSDHDGHGREMFWLERSHR